MAFPAEIKNFVDEYARTHLPPEQWHFEFFHFIDDKNLARRLGEEFISARYIYKVLEGLEADAWLKRAQIRNQILAYASIYEAALHHLLFVNCAEDPKVVALTEFPMKKIIYIPQGSMEALRKHLQHDGKEIIPTYEGIGRTETTKVRFDRKAKCAYELGIIQEWLMDDLIEIYEARNSIHIHAEIRKSLEYELELSMNAYRRMQPFGEQASAWMAKCTV